MPSKEKPQNYPDFNSCVNQLSEIIGFEQPEKLSQLIRRAVKWALEESSHTNPKSSESGELTFEILPGAGMMPEFELSFYQNNKQRPNISVKFGCVRYRGFPNQSPGVKELDDIPPLVERRLIYVQEYRKGNGKKSNKVQHNGSDELKMDLEVNGKGKK